MQARNLLKDSDESSDATMRVKVKREASETELHASDDEAAQVADSSQDSQATDDDAAAAAASGAEEESGQEELSPTTTMSEADTSWRECRQFLLRLSCLTEEGTPLLFRDDLRKHLTVSKDYTICGYQSCQSGGGPSIILVNRADTALSLEPDVVGRVLGIPSTGLAIPGKGKERHRRFMEKHVVPQKLREGAAFHKDGLVTDSILPRLRDYIKEERRKLFLPGKPTLIPVAHAYAMAQDYFHKKVFNWARHRTDYIKRRLDRGTLPLTGKDLLCHYISLALPCVVRAPDGVHVWEEGEPGEQLPHIPRLQAREEATIANWEDEEFGEMAGRVKSEEGADQGAAETPPFPASKTVHRKFDDSPQPVAQEASEIVTSSAGREARENKNAKMQVVEAGSTQDNHGRNHQVDNHQEHQTGKGLEPMTPKPYSVYTQGLRKRKQADADHQADPQANSEEDSSTQLFDQVTEAARSLDGARDQIQTAFAAMRSKLEARDTQIKIKEAENSELFRQLTACQSQIKSLEKIVDGYAEWRRASTD